MQTSNNFTIGTSIAPDQTPGRWDGAGHQQFYTINDTAGLLSEAVIFAGAVSRRNDGKFSHRQPTIQANESPITMPIYSATIDLNRPITEVLGSVGLDLIHRGLVCIIKHTLDSENPFFSAKYDERFNKIRISFVPSSFDVMTIHLSEPGDSPRCILKIVGMGVLQKQKLEYLKHLKILKPEIIEDILNSRRKTLTIAERPNSMNWPSLVPRLPPSSRLSQAPSPWLHVAQNLVRWFFHGGASAPNTGNRFRSGFDPWVQTSPHRANRPHS